MILQTITLTQDKRLLYNQKIMTWTVVGLGNPGEEYVGTRHNVGRDLVASLLESKKSPKAKLVVLDSFMNHSGRAVAKIIKSQKAAKNLLVIHDDLDLPLGTLKLSFNRGAAGHRGVESIVKALKTQGFGRLRIGIARPQGKVKMPDFILAKFTPAEKLKIKKVYKTATEALKVITEEDLSTAMNKYN